MNRFDRITSLLLLLQTRTLVTARFLSEHFNVSERTIYRDIRTLENAGVPIGAEAGLGYFLEAGYHLPPVSFTLDEAAALLLGEKLLIGSLDEQSLRDFQHAVNKIRAVIDRKDKDYLSALETDTEVFPTGSHFPLDEPRPHQTANAEHLHAPHSKALTQGSDRWLKECRSALVHRQVVKISYAALSSTQTSNRVIEPIGLFYYSWHWHLIAWCRLREAYRDFRLDRILSFAPLAEQFARHSRLTLQEYLNKRPEQEALIEVVLLFNQEAARFVGEQRYMFGFIEEEQQTHGVKMRFLTAMPDYMARWLLQYLDEVEVLQGDAIKNALQAHTLRLSRHWHNSSTS